MIDPNHLRKNLADTARRLANRKFTLDTEAFTRIETARKDIQTSTQQLQSKRNNLAKQIGMMKGKGEDVSAILSESNAINAELGKSEKTLQALTEEMNNLMAVIPNLPHESVPIGASEADNIEVRRFGTPRVFDFPIKDHTDLGERHGGINVELAGKISGARFSILRNGFARLHEALARFMLDTHVEAHGYSESYVPYLVNSSTLFGTGQLPKFADDLFQCTADGLYLIPTAEVTLANLLREQIIDDKNLPIKLVARTPCFRREAGSYGKDVRGMIRQHQFDKVELVWATRPEDSYAALETLVGQAETILQRLELPYRVLSLCTGDMGFGAAKTYDLEVWLPSQNTYREISSCSNCEDFQSRRMMARYKNSEGKNEYLHLLNGSGVAVGRALVAVLENYQQADGSIAIPKVLQPYCFGQTEIRG